jgi:hypothetical protein
MAVFFELKLLENSNSEGALEETVRQAAAVR